MVAAGVYMLCRVFFLMPPGALVIAWIGGFTALLAALIAVQQNDIKRILAYSTLSQLGYMVMGVGLGRTDTVDVSSYHACVFQSAVIPWCGFGHFRLHHEQDIWKMGALRKKMPVTFWTFLVGTLALAGVPPFSGFYSKDSILARASEVHAYGAFLLGAVIAVLTSFYMFRLVLVVFFGPTIRTFESHSGMPKCNPVAFASSRSIEHHRWLHQESKPFMLPILIVIRPTEQ